MNKALHSLVIEKIKVGNRYTATFQEIEWECGYCGAENTIEQNISNVEDLTDPLHYNCHVCNLLHEVPKRLITSATN